MEQQQKNAHNLEAENSVGEVRLQQGEIVESAVQACTVGQDVSTQSLFEEFSLDDIEVIESKVFA